MPELVSLLPIIAIAVLFWFLLIRPQARRQKEQVRMQASVRTGERVMLTSGIYGTLRSEDGDTVTLEVADGVVLEVARAAIAQVLAADEPTPPAAGESATGTEEN
ncbi:preprotein translocase subunit YajC [Nocardioides taihuensis]|uniref:Preprotein translocase subunit YajC n=1 Tax=Nocardioides taihuensis TaxID=1835606 RepID=A0ABW0BQN2_9ACTN